VFSFKTLINPRRIICNISIFEGEDKVLPRKGEVMWNPQLQPCKTLQHSHCASSKYISLLIHIIIIIIIIIITTTTTTTTITNITTT
jgi:hypothetical protein